MKTAKDSKKSDNTIENAVIYARYSSSGQREESIEGQIRECREYAARNNLRVVGEYSDHALTGRSDKRPDFQRMIRDSEKGHFTVLICWKIDRFSRDRYDSAIYKYRLHRNGVRILYAKESIPEGPEGIIFESIMEGYAEYYSKNLAQNIKRGYYENALACKVLSYPAYGYRKGADGRYEINPDTAVIVQRVFSDYLSGKGTKQIADELNSAGYRNPRSGGVLTVDFLRVMLQNKKYTGLYEYEDISIPDGIPRLISDADFERVQIMLSRKKTAPAAKMEKYMLSGKLVCGKCGDTLAGEYGKSHTGTLHHYYMCHNRKQKGGCDLKRYRRDSLDQAVTDELIRLVMDDTFIEEVADLVIQYQDKEITEQSRIPGLEAQLQEIERKIGNLTKTLEDGLDSPAVRSRLVELEAQRTETETALAKERLTVPELTREQVIFFMEKLRKGDADDPKYRARLVETFLQAAYVYDDHVVIALNYSGSQTPITKKVVDDFENIEKTDFSGSSKKSVNVEATQSNSNLVALNTCRASWLYMSHLLHTVKLYA